MEMEALLHKLREAIGEENCMIPEIPEEILPVLELLLDQLTQEACQRRKAEELLSFMKASADSVPNPIFIKDDQLRFVFFNRAYREFFGLSEGENLGKRVQDLEYLSPEDRARYHNEDSQMLQSLSVIQYDTTYQTANQGHVEALYWSKGFLVPETGQRGLVGEIVDISKEKATQRALSQSMRTLEVLMRDAKGASNTDPLTKLYNRNILDEDTPAIVKEAELLGQPVCMMLIDVDHFKQVNDTYGHPFGDEILCRFSQILKKTFRQRDIAIRYGGDEFMLVLPGAVLTQAQASAHRLQRAVCEGCPIPDGRCLTLSIGITQWRQGDDLETFIARADEALYQAKKSGRNRVVTTE
ncbi:MAG: diguanylate cyclase [Lachnospiraceae bacterium]|nr:diguanylate cyclase [Lachnospiraceae bacterium]